LKKQKFGAPKQARRVWLLEETLIRRPRRSGGGSLTLRAEGPAGAFGVVVMVNHVERAFLAWPSLVERAIAKMTISYGELAAVIGIHVRPIRYVLSVIQGGA
jgi:hypothetical protein